jgi:energy-coupling factor transporter transmembrane protein EcfT
MNYPLLNIFFTTMWFFMWVLWIFLLVRVFTDLFRDREISGWAKAGWSVLLIVLPFVGVLIYMIVRGRSMADRDLQRAQQSESEFRSYVRDAAAASPAPNTTDQLARLVDLKNHGDLTTEEYEQAKTKILTAA